MRHMVTESFIDRVIRGKSKIRADAGGATVVYGKAMGQMANGEAVKPLNRSRTTVDLSEGLLDILTECQSTLALKNRASAIYTCLAVLAFVCEKSEQRYELLASSADGGMTGIPFRMIFEKGRALDNNGKMTRINLEMSSTTDRSISLIAKELELTARSEVIRGAIRFFANLNELLKEGQTIYLRSENGELLRLFDPISDPSHIDEVA